MARLLLEEDGCQVVGEAADGRSAIAAASSLRPHVVLLDVGLPDMDGFAVARVLRSQPAAGHVVVLCSSRSRSDYGSGIEECGARGFIPKSELSGPVLLRLVQSEGPMAGEPDDRC